MSAAARPTSGASPVTRDGSVSCVISVPDSVPDSLETPLQV